MPGVRVFGSDGLDQALSQAEILITLLPDTPHTRGLLDAGRLALLPKDAWLINPGRGTVLDDDALLAALDKGHLGHAVLDVFRAEPLAPRHPFWSHPRVTVTPHVAAATRPGTSSTRSPLASCPATSDSGSNPHPMPTRMARSNSRTDGT